MDLRFILVTRRDKYDRDTSNLLLSCCGAGAEHYKGGQCAPYNPANPFKADDGAGKGAGMSAVYPWQKADYSHRRRALFPPQSSGNDRTFNNYGSDSA